MMQQQYLKEVHKDNSVESSDVLLKSRITGDKQTSVHQTTASTEGPGDFDMVNVEMVVVVDSQLYTGIIVLVWQ